MADNDSPSTNQDGRFAEAFRRVEPQLAAFEDSDLVTINVDVPSAVATAFGVLPKLQGYRAALAALGIGFDIKRFDQLEELAMALSAQSQLAMLHDDLDRAIALGERAAAMARALGDDETVVHALTNVGTALIGGPETERGRALLAEAIALTRDDDNRCRALINRAAATFSRRRGDPRIAADLDAALAFATEHEL